MAIALSWSRLSDYNQCPLKFKMKYIDKEPMFKEDEKDSPHLVRGANVHKALENYAIQKITNEEVTTSSLPEVESTKPFIDRLFANYPQVIPESQIAINSQWQRVEWFDRSAYMRAIMDVIALRPEDAIIGDYKTGKMRDYDGGPSGFGQLHLSGAIALSLWPNIPKVTTVYIYVDHKKTLVKSFTQDDREKLVTHFTSEHDKVNSDKEFKPKVNEFCKWCPVTRKHCAYSRKI